ncbi:MAG: TatD family hydrolase [Pseudomonadota bacterium]
MFDTHVNLHDETYADDLPEVVENARAAGVRRFLAICDRLDNLQAVKAIAKSYDGMWCSAGVHPHHSKDFADLTAERLVEETNDPTVVAIGETGLDFHYNYSAEDVQISVFKAHIRAAQESGLPLIIHSREADDLMGDLLESAAETAPFTPLLHCYTGGQRLADRALDLGAYFSVSGILSFKSAKDVRAVIDTIPIDRIILETDCPYLTPMPHRGRRNEPAYLPHVCAALANLKGRATDEIAKITEENALELFKRVS